MSSGVPSATTLEAVLKLFMSPLLPENSGCKAQCGGAGGSLFKHCNTANAVSREQPEGLVSVFAHSCVARRSFSYAKAHSSRLELHKNGHQRGTNNFETASRS
jgi:hypothetical protein